MPYWKFRLVIQMRKNFLFIVFLLNNRIIQVKLWAMKLRCTECNFELNLPIKSLPKNTKLYCPKCKGGLSPIEDVQVISQISGAEVTTPAITQNQTPASENKINAPVPPPLNSSDAVSPAIPIPQMTPVNNPAVVSQQPSQLPQMFGEDLKPELEININEEVINSSREKLFEKPSQVWYDSTVSPPPPPVVNISPPPIPTVPPPIPMNSPPPIPVSSSVPQSGYISASSSIQIDSSLVLSNPPPLSQSMPIKKETPVIVEDKIELVTESQPEIARVEKAIQPSSPIKEATPKAETADKKDVILLTQQQYPAKKISITLPAIGLIVLAAIAGFIYYQIVVSSSKSDIIKDLKSTPALGAIPAINSNSVEKSEVPQPDKKENIGSAKSGSSKVPIKAKRSALEHYKNGNRFFMETKFEQARDEYAMAIAADPNFGLAYRGLGATYGKLGQPDLAVKNYEKYIELVPNASDAEQVKSIIKQYYGK